MGERSLLMLLAFVAVPTVWIQASNVTVRPSYH